MNKGRVARPKSEQMTAIKVKERRLKGTMLIEQQKNELSTILAAVFVVLFSYALTTATLVLGVLYEIPDLYLVGGMFGLTSFVLTIIMIVNLFKRFCKSSGAGERELAEIEAQINLR